MKMREVIKIMNNPEVAKWFSEKWNTAVDAYHDSMKESVEQRKPIPWWYIVLNGNGEIVAGSGVIANDFHDCKDLSLNLCALFVEKEYRN